MLDADDPLFPFGEGGDINKELRDAAVVHAVRKVQPAYRRRIIGDFSSTSSYGLSFEIYSFSQPASFFPAAICAADRR
ncbi:MAG TPA: hypothetical protein H9684_01195 [Firmicutes bacterium]|nr:hypothetical protein [Bacillota bacterium]